MNMQEFASNFLTFLERREEKLLSWGFHNVQYSEADMLYALLHEAPQELQGQWNELKASGTTFKTLLRELRQSHLLHRLPEATDMYRTRMAEGVRLLANLRQMFRPQDWATGPRLVSDVKIHLKDRIYPRRDLPPSDIWNDSLKELCPKGSKQLVKECYEALSMDTRGNEFTFAGFQKRSFEHIFKEYHSGNWSASVICAGTGSGKTKAFYVPAFLRLAEEISNVSNPFTKIVAIYPRNVLLADQLREALSESKKLRPVLHRHGHRPITFGALLGSSPRDNWFAPVTARQRRPSWYWEQRADGHVIPYLSSPEDGRSDLIWKKTDRENGRTSLYRLGETAPDVPDGVLRITREQLMQNPPDVLFVSLEMLNREMGNPLWRKTFGIKQGGRAPRLVLLDEVHTYEGIAGAQAAWVLRRWKYWVHSGKKAKPPHFVGLSATLKEAPEHMGRMCGIYPDRVADFAPRPGIGIDGEMEAEGQEYDLAIKGDPSSGTALLSTSIQTAMLLTRLLTPRNHVVPMPAPPIRADIFHLKKAFGFTDNLDSLNRWFSNMRDAERQRLAGLRNMPNPLPDQPILRRMRDEGQIWELPNDIGHNLSQGLDVSRCSSQDPGANKNSDLILATSSLEVGFDDPQVGMILHHKSPTSMSSFIQRKGRAGRTRGSRPWTAVILSDYGRDRWAFQAAERLFNPEIDRIHLPVANPYVLRVQMALFLVDWLGQEIDKADSPFSYLSKRGTRGLTQQAQTEAKRYLEDFLQQGAQWKRFFQSAFQMYFYGRGGLSWKSEGDQAIATSELNDIFWEEPRPLLTVGIPSLLRKLEVEWKQSGFGTRSAEDAGSGRPMPQSIPKATFEELDLNEATIELEAYQRRVKENELLPMPQFLRESCPARVSKRFSTIVNFNQPEPGYWHEYSPRLQPGQNNVSLAQLYSEHISLGAVGNTQIYCPSNAKLTHIPNDIIESSSSEWQWHTIATTHNDDNGETLPLKGSKPWNQAFSRTTAYLHINGSWIELLRYANSCRFEIRRRNNHPIHGTLSLQNDDENSEAVGFKLNVDGLRFEIDSAHLQQMPKITPKMLGLFRYEYFLHQLKTSPALQDHLNVFRAEWMAQISMAMLCATAIRQKIPLPEAQQQLNGRRPDAARRVLETIFQVRGVDLTGLEEESRLKRDILDLWQNANVVSEIKRLEATLWKYPPGPDFDQWVRQRYLATLAQALRLAAATVSDQVNEDDLVVDVISLQENHEILLTEKSSGGLGQIESIVREIRGDPRFFLDALEYSLANCPRKSWATNLFAVTECAHKEYRNGSGALVDAFSEVRNAQNLNTLEQAKESLVAAIHNRGINAQRSNISAVCMKLLRPGSSRNTDTLTHLLNESWQRHSQKVGLEIPIRTFAYIVSYYPPSQRRLLDLFRRDYNQTPTLPQLYAIIQQLLFEGCADSCPDCLNNPNYFNDFGKPARYLALPWLSLGIAEISVSAKVDQWMSKARDALTREGRVCLVAQMDLQDQLTRNLVPLFFEEINVQTYREPVHINRIERTGGYIKLTLHIRDFTNA
jgi:hypothetical protein